MADTVACYRQENTRPLHTLATSYKTTEGGKTKGRGRNEWKPMKEEKDEVM